MTDWRRKADEYDAKAEAAAVAGDVAAGMAWALKAIRLREMAGELERGLRVPSRGGKKRAVEAVERLHVSQGKAPKGSESFHKAVNDAGYTIRSLAKTLRADGWRVSHPYLRQCLDGTANIRLTLAKRIQSMLGKDPETGEPRWAATRQNWPGKAWAKEPSEE